MRLNCGARASQMRAWQMGSDSMLFNNIRGVLTRKAPSRTSRHVPRWVSFS